jgi:hypothetical protein
VFRNILFLFIGLSAATTIVDPESLDELNPQLLAYVWEDAKRRSLQCIAAGHTSLYEFVVKQIARECRGCSLSVMKPGINIRYEVYANMMVELGSIVITELHNKINKSGRYKYSLYSTPRMKDMKAMRRLDKQTRRIAVQDYLISIYDPSMADGSSEIQNLNSRPSAAREAGGLIREVLKASMPDITMVRYDIIDQPCDI